MILITHALTGAVIGKYVQNPALIILISLLVHYSMDSLRHGEYFDDRVATIKNTWWKVALDILIGLILIFSFLFWKNISPKESFHILLGTFSSMFPDLLTVIYWKFGGKILGQVKKFHSFAHHYKKFPRYSPERQWTLRNARNDILISILALALLLF